MSDIRAWLFEPLLKLKQDVRLETGTVPRIEVAVHPALFADAVAAADIRYGAIITEQGVPQEIQLSGSIIIKPWSQEER